MKYLFLLFALSFLAACSNSSTETSEEETSFYTPQLEELWETDSTLIASECVIYDKLTNAIYVSCIGEMPANAHDGDGYIAKVGLDGQIIKKDWSVGLNAPKGLALVGSTLFVTDIDKLIGINTENGEIISSELVEGAVFLNDVDSAPNGDLIMTDSDQNTLYIKNAAGFSTYFANEDLGGINGVRIEDDRLLVTGGKGNIWFVSKDGFQMTVAADSINGGDGVENYKDGYFVSCWEGRLYYFDKNHRIKLLDTKDAGINAADIDVVEEKNLLILPTFFRNTIKAYRIN